MKRIDKYRKYYNLVSDVGIVVSIKALYDAVGQLTKFKLNENDSPKCHTFTTLPSLNS